jgi:hypothetical protein
MSRNTPACRGLWLAAFGAALLLYAATADRGVQWQDSGWQQLRVITGCIEHPLGLALTHPLQYYLGRAAVRLLPVEPAFAVTLVSCLAAAIAVANLAATILVVTRRAFAAVVAATAFALSHTFWQHATHTESYAIVTALLTGEWLCLAMYATTTRSRFLLILSLLNGLGIANHPLASLATPIDLAIIIAAARSGRLSRAHTLEAALLWLAGTLPYSMLVGAALFRTGDLLGTLRSALFSNYASEVLNVHLGLRALALAAGYVLYNLPGLTIPLGLYGVFRPFDVPRVFSRALRWELLIYTVFVARYTITDQYTFFFPVYAMLALFSGISLVRIIAAPASLRRGVVLALAALTAAWTPLVYVTAASVLSARKAFDSMVRHKPYRDGYAALFLPWGVGHNFGAILNEQAYRLADDNGLIVFEDPMLDSALRYPQAIGRASPRVTVMQIESRTASAVVAARTRSLLESCRAAGRPVILVPRDRDRPSTCVPESRWKRVGDLYILTEISPNPS